MDLTDKQGGGLYSIGSRYSLVLGVFCIWWWRFVI